ncbi:MAG TPA: glycosyltransferase 87 family protein, partial [Blastocatellia bacterium]|nr:glycosyltransferase 87 family protein [Blastocatellia bacterium]
LSSDIYRYIWDGRVQASGINPYRYVPGAPELSYLRDDHIYPFINRRDFAQTIYPPFAQAVFLAGYLASPSSVTGFKLVLISFDGIAAVAIILALRRLGLDAANVIFFAWHPLIIWEGAHSGHVEPVVTACLALAILARVADKPVGTGVALALATLTKFYPALLLPLFATRPVPADPAYSRLRSLFTRLDLRTLTAFVVVIIAGYLPYLRAGSLVLGYLPGYFKEEGFVESGSRYFLLAVARKLVPLPTAVYALAAVAVLGVVIGWAMFRAGSDHKALLRYAAAVIGLFLTISAPRYSWYLACLVPFICFVPSIAWLYLTGASIFLYLLWLTTDYPNVPIWLAASLYVPPWLFHWWERRRR